MQGARVAVLGAGVVGLCTALAVQAEGARTLLFDPAALGDNASGVAAGMLAPAFESALDPVSKGQFALLRDGRDLWPDLLQGEAAISRQGALWAALPGRPGELETVAANLAREGAAFEQLDVQTACSLAAGLTPELVGALWTPDDSRIDPAAVMEALATRFQAKGGEVRRQGVQSLATRRLSVEGSAFEVDAVVVCAGWEAKAFAGAIPEFEALFPIKGEVGRFPGADPREGPAVRSCDVYLAPSGAGPIVGATMEAGVADRRVTPEATRNLANGAARLMPHLGRAPPEGRAGVRAATPDGLPLVGRARSGVWIAAGFRRNGWTLAPLAARITADLLCDRNPGPWAERLRPGRFLVSHPEAERHAHG